MSLREIAGSSGKVVFQDVLPNFLIRAMQLLEVLSFPMGRVPKFVGTPAQQQRVCLSIRIRKRVWQRKAALISGKGRELENTVLLVPTVILQENVSLLCQGTQWLARYCILVRVTAYFIHCFQVNPC